MQVGPLLRVIDERLWLTPQLRKNRTVLIG